MFFFGGGGEVKYFDTVDCLKILYKMCVFACKIRLMGIE